jgi:hypothetical protein
MEISFLVDMPSTAAALVAYICALTSRLRGQWLLRMMLLQRKANEIAPKGKRGASSAQQESTETASVTARVGREAQNNRPCMSFVGGL